MLYRCDCQFTNMKFENMSFNIITYAVILLCLKLTHQCLAKCPNNFDEHGTKCSSLVYDKMDFQKALAYCNSLNATLPEPRSQTEFDVLRQLPDYWLGVRDLGLVPSQRTFSYISDNVTVSYNGWKMSGEPMPHLGQVVCTIFKEGIWQVTECDQKHNVVCETIPCPRQYTRKGKKCYNIVREMKTYQEATKACEGRNGLLAEPGTTKEKDNVIELIQESQNSPGNSITQNLWLGAKCTKDGRWVWQHSGDIVNSSMIDSIQYTGEGYCLVMDKTTGDLRGRGCLNRRSLLCESGRDGGVSSWEDWSECSVSDGACLRHRGRECDNPVPRYGGRQCEELLTESEICATRNCGRINCQSNPNPCGHGHHRCVSLTDGRYTCECGVGYRLENKPHPTCIAVNKCESTKDICKSLDGTEHTCVYTPGSKHSYMCDCQEGYENVGDHLCDPFIDRPKPPKETLLDLLGFPMVKGVVFTLGTYNLLFIVWVIVMDVKLFLVVIYRLSTTEPLPESGSDDEGGMHVDSSNSHSNHWQCEDFVLETGEYIWVVRGRVDNTPVDISSTDNNSLDDSSSSLLINSLDSATQSDFTSTSTTCSTQLTETYTNQS